MLTTRNHLSLLWKSYGIWFVPFCTCQNRMDCIKFQWLSVTKIYSLFTVHSWRELPRSSISHLHSGLLANARSNILWHFHLRGFTECIENSDLFLSLSTHCPLSRPDDTASSKCPRAGNVREHTDTSSCLCYPFSWHHFLKPLICMAFVLIPNVVWLHGHVHQAVTWGAMLRSPPSV